MSMNANAKGHRSNTAAVGMPNSNGSAWVKKDNEAPDQDKKQGKDDKGQVDQDRMKIDQEEKAEETTTVRVKTKTEDGGSQVASSSTRYGRDAFLHYSNDTIRMRHLLGHDEEDAAAAAANEDIQDHQEGAEVEATKRKTRISFELHDSAFYEEWLGPFQE